MYFKVYKDDVVLPIEEVSAAMESGEITIDKHSVGWLTLLPCGMEVSIEELDGESVIVCRVIDDMARPWDNLFASFIFARQKTISLNYNEAIGSDVILIRTMNFWSMLWRWIVLLLILLFLIHLILFIIGFFVAKPLPKGTFLQFDIRRGGGARMSVQSMPQVNFRFIDKLKWHLFRFIPFMELKDQRPIDLGNGMELRVNKKTKDAEIIAKYSKVVKYTRAPDQDSRAPQSLKAMMKKYRAGEPASSVKDVTQGTFKKLLTRSPGTPYNPGSPLRTGGWYGVIIERKKGDRRIEIETKVISFVEVKE